MEVLQSFWSRYLSWHSPKGQGQDADHPLDVLAVPGLMTLLDVALYRSVEGQLTGTTCAGHALLQAWLDLKHQAQLVLVELQQQSSSTTSTTLSSAESFARTCMETAWDATERLSTDKLAHSANLSDPYDNSTSGSSNHVLSGVGIQGIVSGVLESKEETGRRFIASEQRPKDCWESSRLFCPDYVWADDVLATCQRLLRNLTKHSFYSDDVETIVGTAIVSSMDKSSNSQNGGGSSSSSKSWLVSPGAERHLSLLLQLVKEDIPVRLHQFKAAVEADSVVSKRLYLVKCEYRAPFRAFLEAQQSVQRAPSIEIVNEYLALSNSSNNNSNNNKTKLQQKKEQAQQKLQKLLETPELVQALSLERKCEEIEIELAKALFPFTELARMVEHKRARLMAVPGVVDEEKVTELQELLRRLKYLLCRRAGPETSTGIRPLLLDIHGMPRDEDPMPATSATAPSDSHTPSPQLDLRSMRRLRTLVHNLQTLGSILNHTTTTTTTSTTSTANHKNNKNAFHTDKRTDVDFPATIVKGCTDDFDPELFQCQVQDFFTVARRQNTLVRDNNNNNNDNNISGLESAIRKAEMEMSIAVASHESLGMVRQRLELIATDRQKRFEVLQQIVEEVCLREMNWHVRVVAPDKGRTLLLRPNTSALGLFGLALQRAGEPLPIG